MADNQKEPLIVNPYGITDEGEQPGNTNRSNNKFGQQPNL